MSDRAPRRSEITIRVYDPDKPKPRDETPSTSTYDWDVDLPEPAPMHWEPCACRDGCEAP